MSATAHGLEAIGAGRASTPTVVATRGRRRTGWTAGDRVGTVVLVVLLLLAAFGPFLAEADPGRQSLRARLEPPIGFGGDWTHPLGTDQLGRDLYARLLAGARTSLAIGAAATLVAVVMGVALGVLAGYLGGGVDRAITFASDAQISMPFVIVAIGVVSVLGTSTRNVVLVLAITGWVAYARVVRLQAAVLRNAPFVEAARAMGASRIRVMSRHIVPNITGPVIVLAAQQLAAMILYEAALSYLGLGVPAGTITWGGIVADGRETLLTAWWVSTFPGLAIAVTILGLNLFGDRLQRVLAGDAR